MTAKKLISISEGCMFIFFRKQKDLSAQIFNPSCNLSEKDEFNSRLLFWVGWSSTRIYVIHCLPAKQKY
jgi:hypothetical protein